MNRQGRPARWAGRLLCWTLAAAMAAAAIEAVFSPGAALWHALWPVPWYLVPVWALLWAGLRAREKRAGDPARRTDADDHGRTV